MSFTPSQPINTKVTRFWHTDIVTAVIKYKNQCIKGTYMTLLGPKGVPCNGSPIGVHAITKDWLQKSNYNSTMYYYC